jgi:hypothetical protein
MQSCFATVQYVVGYAIRSQAVCIQHSEDMRDESEWNFTTVPFPVMTVFIGTFLLVSECSMHKETCQKDDVEEWPHTMSNSWQTPCK